MPNISENVVPHDPIPPFPRIDVTGIARAVRQGLANVPALAAKALDFSHASESYGGASDTFTITLDHTRVGDRLTLEHVRPVYNEEIDGNVIAVDSMTFLVSPQGARKAIPSAHHHIQSASFEGAAVREKQSGAVAAHRIADDLLENLHLYGPGFIEGIEDMEAALRATYILMDAHSILAQPAERFGTDPDRDVNELPAAIDNPFADIASRLETEVHPIPAPVDPLMAL